MSEKESKGFWAVLGHPLFLLLVGSVIGSFLIPWCGDKMSKNKVLQEARLRKAVEIVESNTKTVSQLNGMVTRLSSFHDTNTKLKPAPAKVRELQEKLVEDMASRWSDFDKYAWWWPEDLNTEAMILGTIPASGAGTLRKDIDDYKKNILDTSNAMKELWSPCISADYDYKDERINKIREEMRKKLVDQFNARNQLVTNLVNDFKEPK